MDQPKQTVLVDKISMHEIIQSIKPYNHTYFVIDDLESYAKKILDNGKCMAIRSEEDDSLLAFLLYYDNQPGIYISMLWTTSKFRRTGNATKLMNELFARSNKEIFLEVHEDNPAIGFYRSLNFQVGSQEKSKYKMYLPAR